MKTAPAPTPPPQRDDIVDLAPAGRRFTGADRRAPLRKALKRWGQYGPGQTAGRFYPMACVALEVTQRCNLDCALCYLSDSAEMVHDVPLPVLYERIAMLESHYGPKTSIQITGGDPTLRSAEDLEAICRHIRARGMRSCLMTNGIRASRDLLARLAAAGLDDVAFHVDLTQERKGYPTEASLNTVREAYIARARGLGLRILFNTTVFEGNLAEIPVIAGFFRAHAAALTLVSFQLQADTGRGVLRERHGAVTRESVMAAISDGMGTTFDFDVAAVGHEACNRYASVLVAGDEAISALGNPALFQEVFKALEEAERLCGGYLLRRKTIPRAALRNPWLTLRMLGHGLKLIWRLRGGLRASRGRVHRLSVHVHNFMDASRLERDRCDSCVFMVATEDGPLSMCVHNARRDHHLLAPARVETADGIRWWSAATGRLTETPEAAEIPEIPAKRRKGRLRAATLPARSKGHPG